MKEEVGYVCIPSPHPLSEGGELALSYGIKDLREITERVGEDFDSIPVLVILNTLGIDTSKEITTDYGEYRSILSNKVETGYIIRGVERVDKEWLESGACSDDNRIVAKSGEDHSFRKELLDLSRVPCFTQMTMDSVGG